MRLGTALTIVAMLAATPAMAQRKDDGDRPSAPPIVRTLSGVWELAGQGGARSCRLSLNPIIVAHGYSLGLPPVCRQALPVMATASSWSYNSDGTISLRDGAGISVLDLRRSPDAPTFVAQVGADQFVLTPISGQPPPAPTGRRAAKPVPQTPEERAQAVAAALANQPIAEQLQPLQPAALVGLYGIARDKFRPICSIDLTDRPAARRGQYVAVLSGGCLDAGMKIFDPIGWRTERGRLLLVARKGHEQSFAPAKDGVFEKNPPSGQQLYLKKQ